MGKGTGDPGRLRAENEALRRQVAALELDLQRADAPRDLTEHKRVEQALRESELKHRTLFETAGDAILLMRRDRIIDCNARSQAMFGCSRDEIIGATPHRFSPPLQPDGRRSEDKALEKITLALTQGQQYFAWEHCRADGSPFAAEVSLNRLELDGESLLQAMVRDVTERRRVEAALQEREIQLASILNNVSDIVFAVSVEPDDTFRFTSVNRRFLETTGLAEDRVVGALVRDVIPPQAHALVFGKYREAIRSGQPARWEEVSEYPAGRKVAYVTVVPVPDAQGRCTQLVGMVHDITERTRMEEALRAREREYRELVMLANSIILRWSRDGRVTFLNEFGQRFFGFPDAEIVGRHVVGTIVPASESTGRGLGPLMEEICAHPQQFQRSVNENMRRNGERVWIDWTNKVVCDEQGRPKEILSIGSDITDRVKAEEEVRRLNDDLRRHAEELEERVRARTAQLAARNQELKDFAYTVSHDLKAPLRGIAGYASELDSKHRAGLSERARFCLAQILTATAHLDQLIEDLLHYSRLDSETPSLTDVNLPNLVGVILRDRELIISEQHAEVTVSIPFTTLRTWERGLVQVLTNLIDNALKYSRKADPPRVRIAAEALGRAWRLSVSDNGVGFDMKYHDRIFGLFNRLVRMEDYEGTGAGLAIVRKVLDKQGGRIRAESAPGQGATFFVEIPMPGTAG
jgi:PAS domain S-box-containing protein